MKVVPGNYRYYGYYCQPKNEIGLASEDESVFFHELSHYAHQRVTGDFQKTPSWEKEVVAELSAAALCKMVGKDSRHIGTNFQYIRHYAEQEGLSPLKACLKVINQTEAALALILKQPASTTESEPVSPYGFSEDSGAFAQEQAAL